MQDSRYPMAGTNEVLVPAVGYGRVLIDVFLDACCTCFFQRVVFDFGINFIEFQEPWGYIFEYFEGILHKNGKFFVRYGYAGNCEGV